MKGDVRIGDTEREGVARLLREHCAAGRLELDELDERLETAYGARTRQQLDAVTADLPEAASSRAGSVAKLWWPGTAAFHVERQLRDRPEAVYADALRVVVPRMAIAGYQLYDDVPPRRLGFRSATALHVGLILHPAIDGGTIVAAFGVANWAVRRAFATLRD